jgi:hydrogenase maturation protease
MLGSQFGVSSHAVGLAEVIELGRVLKQLPPHLSVVGIEGADFRPGAGLSPAVARAVPKAVRLVRALLTGLVSNQS